MRAADKARHVVAGAILTCTIAALVLRPTSLHAMLVFAAVGIVAGGAFLIRTTLARLIGAGILIIGTDWLQSIVTRGDLVIAWYQPILISTSLTIVVYYVAGFVNRRKENEKRRQKPSL